MATGYSIKKLGFGQPMMILDHISMKKRNNREAAATPQVNLSTNSFCAKDFWCREGDSNPHASFKGCGF